MAVSSKEYQKQIKNLLPLGIAWNRADETSVFALMIECWAMEFARVDARILTMIEEVDPRNCIETLDEWLHQWGVPDECLTLWGELTNAGLVPNVLRKALIQKVTEQGGNSIPFFLRLAKSYGYDIQIQELGQLHTVMSPVTQPMGTYAWAYHWKATVLRSSSAVEWHKATGDATEPVAWWGDKIIECLLRKYVPAHTELHISYTD